MSLGEFDEWKEKGRLFDLGCTIFGILPNNIPEECKPLGEVIETSDWRNKNIRICGPDEMIGRVVKERQPLANSYIVLRVDMSPQKTEYKIQACKTDEAWLREKYNEAQIGVKSER